MPTMTMTTTTSTTRTISMANPANPVAPTPNPIRQSRPLLWRPRFNVSTTHRGQSRWFSSPTASPAHRSSRARGAPLAESSQPTQRPTQIRNCQSAHPRASPAPRPPRLLSFGVHRLAILALPRVRPQRLSKLSSKTPHQAPVPVRSVGAPRRPPSPRPAVVARRVALAVALNSTPICSKSGVAASATAVRSDAI